MTAPRILFVSNGHGEMAIAGYIARAVAAARPNAVVEHLPLVGEPAQDSWPPAVGPRAAMPSGGLIAFWNLKNIVRDLRAGLGSLSVRQFAFLRRRRDDAVVAVGDIYCVAACLLFARRPTVFVATAKSEYVAPHSGLECAIARRARIVFARDAATAQALERRGIHAVFSGNVMMDGLASEGLSLPASANAVRIAVLPGSRSDARANVSAAVRRLKLIAARLAPRGESVQAYISQAPTIAADELIAGVQAEGLTVECTGAAAGVMARASGENLEIALVGGALGDLLRASDIVLGQAGTGNEQAVGLGKPVVSAADVRRGRPESVGWYRMRQQRLLGDALLVLPTDDTTFADGVVALLDDSARRAKMSQAGRERMGGTGAARAIAEAVLAVAANVAPS
ncbi:MAG TPA: lipid-A-disaccharide synthase-related protein [Candidatus Eremiobacteraceae bacterium]|nr:lipid-A-disaccharide synthase-related protein [Candidatus Eremiobacteraceae bacterium]